MNRTNKLQKKNKLGLESSEIVHFYAINFIYTYRNLSENKFIMPVDGEENKGYPRKKRHCKS